MLVEHNSVVRDQVGYARSGAGVQHTPCSAQEALDSSSEREGSCVRTGEYLRQQTS
jgi:hypothetical protein